MARKRGRVAAHILVWLWVLSQFGYRSNTAGETADGHGRCVRALELDAWTAAIDVAVKLARSRDRLLIRANTFIQLSLNHRLGATLALLRVLCCFLASSCEL